MREGREGGTVHTYCISPLMHTLSNHSITKAFSSSNRNIFNTLRIVYEEGVGKSQPNILECFMDTTFYVVSVFFCRSRDR